MTEIATCSRCGEEVRWGWRPSLTSPQRPGSGFWMHRDPETDHHVILGQMVTPEMQAANEAAKDEPRTREDGTVYTTRQADLAKMKKAAREAVEEEDDDFELEPLPDPEVYSTPIEIGDPRLPGGAKQILVLAAKHGWTGWATYSRGPRTHKTLGTVLSISDFVVVRLRLDGGLKRGVASWIDASFDNAWVGPFNFDRNAYIPGPANFAALKTYIKHEEEE